MSDPRNPTPTPPWGNPKPVAKPAPVTRVQKNPDAAVPPGKRRKDPTILMPAAKPTVLKGETPLVATPNAYIVVTAGAGAGQHVSIQGERLVIGRESPADFLIDDAAASRRHAQIYRKNDRWFLKDLGSTNGTYLDGPLRGSERPLNDGDVFRIGAVEFVFSDPASAAPRRR